MIEGANKNLDNFYFENKKLISAYLVQKAFYINGFAVRYFLDKKVKTFGGITDNQYIKKFSKKDYLASRNCKNVNKSFKKLKDKRIKIRISKRYLENKFQGKKVKGLDRMRESPYGQKKKFKISRKFDVVVFLPEFSDAPHSYGNFAFNDCNEWVHETIKFLKLQKLNIAIKEHPNTWLHSSQMFIDILKKKYSGLVWFNKNISNLAIFNKKPKFGISPFGTVLHELAYHNIIPIAAGNNPYMSYDFVFTPKNKKDYFSLISLAAKNKLKLKKNYKEKIAECYYMYFLHNDDYMENYSRSVNLKDHLHVYGKKDIYSILKKFNEGHFK